MSNEHRYLEVADRIDNIASHIGTRTDGIVLLKKDPPVVNPGLGLNSHATALSDNATDVRQGITYVSTFGGVCAGKTSFVCAITGLDLPIGVDAKTGVITQIVNGDDLDTVEVFYSDRTEKKMTLDEFNAFSSLPAGSIKSGVPFPLPPHLMNVRFARAQSASELSKSGVILVDTLGFNAGKLAADASKLHLKATDIVILILGTRPPFTDTDVESVLSQVAESQINDPKLRHIFVVLNDFALRSEEKEEVWKAARIKLEGLFDEDEFENQVFMVNVHGALEARRNGEPERVIEATGLPKLERALENSLQGSKQIVMESVAARRVAPGIRAGRTEIAKQQAGINANQEQLQSAVEEGQKALKASQQQAEAIVKQFKTAGASLTDAVINNYSEYFNNQVTRDDWRNAWEEHGPTIGIIEFTLSAFGKKRRERLEKRLRKPVEQLIGGQINAWTEQLPQTLKDNLKEFKKFEHLATNFVESLVKTDEKLVQEFGINTAELDVTRKKENGKRLLQTIFGILSLDPSQIVGSLYAPDWGAFFRRLIIEVMAAVTAILLFGPLGIIAAISVIVAEFLLNLIIDQKNRKSKLAWRVADKIRQQFTAESARIIDQIRSKMDERLGKHTEELQAVLNGEIAERETRLNQLLDQKYRKEHTAERERLQRIDTALTEQWQAISTLVYGEVIDISEVSDPREDDDETLFTHN